MRVFRPGYKCRDGSRRKTTKWYVEFRDHSECIRRIPAFSSKPASTEMGRNLEMLVAFYVSSGGQTDPKLTPWIETLPTTTKERLVAIGLLDKKNAAFAKPLSTHLTDFERNSISKGNTDAYVKLLVGRIRKVFDECGFHFWSEVSASRIVAYLGDRRSHQIHNDGKKLSGLSAQTSNFYLQAVKQFCRWMVKDGRASESPLSHVSGLNVKTDRRHDRRALDVDEIRWLLETTRRGPTQSGRTWSMTGDERAILYWLAVETGIRSSELRSLTPASFDFESDVPTVTVEAAYSKRRRRDVQPLRHELAGCIRLIIVHRTPATRIFKMPRKENVAVMYRSDLENARKNWITEAADSRSKSNRKSSDFSQIH